MAVLKPFAAVRPVPSLVRQVAALPYDVMNSDEAREMVRDNPYSFLHVDKAEIDLDPSVDPYDDQVYAKAADTLKRMRADGIYIQDEKPCLYIYGKRCSAVFRPELSAVHPLTITPKISLKNMK